ncbi:hypothetical protein [Prevotella sp. HUN102]|uniref:hypothetical protein n=1 Tax=Prevotella sp. HUN102 TaxID=1392486 RepID=UPI00048ECED1|nr:hypothetical protein [Prevotella sp. HUN102]
MINHFRNIFRRKIQLSELAPSINRRLVSKALSALNCQYQWKKDGEDQTAFYDFQSGHFGIRVQQNAPNVLLSFPYIAEAPMEHVNNVRQLCNQFNLSSDGPRFTYVIDEEKNVINVHLLHSLLLDEDRARDILSRTMTDLFGWQNVFVRKLGDLVDIQKNTKSPDVELTSKQLSRELFMLREQELNHQAAVPRWRENEVEKITFSQWMKTVFGIDDFFPSQLMICSDEPKTVTEKEAINNLSFASLLIENGKFVRKEATLSLVFFQTSEPDRRRFMTLFVQQADGSEQALYYRVTATVMPLLPNGDAPLRTRQYQPTVRTTLLAYDLRTDKQLLDEFNFMWEDAKDKIAKGETGQLTEEQLFIAKISLRNVAHFMYRGKQLYLSGRHYEAALWLENAFHILHDSFSELNTTDHENFFEICYMLGFCHSNMQDYERAFYYLTFTLGLNRITYTEEYINCLVNMSDFRAMGYINSIIADIENIYNNGEEDENPEPHLQSFLSFLYRRKAYVLIEKKNYDAAEALLKHLLNDPNSSEYALKELVYLQKLREKKE